MDIYAGAINKLKQNRMEGDMGDSCYLHTCNVEPAVFETADLLGGRNMVHGFLFGKKSNALF